LQDRYAGDVGDFGKLALLRALTHERRLGVCWYKTSGTNERTNDGRHLAYVQRPMRFRHLDVQAFDALSSFIDDVRTGRRRRAVESIEELGLTPAGTIFHGILCPSQLSLRQVWFREMLEAMEGADLVFLDPDNGLEAANIRAKSAAVSELVGLQRRGRALLLYHHQTRHKGGAKAEAEAIGRRLRQAGFASVEGIRLRPYSSRFYFLLDANAALRQRLHAFASLWGREAQLYPP
jgi:hypothetical protein